MTDEERKAAEEKLKQEQAEKDRLAKEAEAEAAKKRIVFESSEQLNERLERDRKTYLKKLGFGSPEELEALKARDADAAKKLLADEEAKKSEIQRLSEAKSKAEQEAQAKAIETEEALMRAAIFRTCAELGIKNVDYAVFEVTQKLANSEGDLDEKAFLSELLKTKGAALGVGSTETVVKPVETTDQTGTNNDGKITGQGDAKPVDVMSMKPAEFEKYKQEKYGTS